MEPNYPGTTNTPTNYPSAPPPDATPPKKRWPFSKKVTIILILAVAVIALVIAAFSLNKGSTSNKGDKNKSSLYIQRAGFEDDGDGIGDALALISKPTSKVVQYGGVNIVQPCSIITLKDIRDTGLRISANQLAVAVNRTYMDGVGQASLPKPSGSFLPF